MLKIWFPKTFEELNQETVAQYICYCNIAMYTLKNILQSNINSLRWNTLTSRLTESNLIQIDNPIKFNAIRIPNQYISRLCCTYDPNISKCYYYVPDSVKCQYTSNTLNQVVELAEYGNDVIPPMNWIRYSYTKFVDRVMRNMK